MLLLFLIWGSFLNVVAYRLIKGESLIWPGSKCPTCSHPISWYDNIPLISWIMLSARCRHCTKPISALYPFIELITALTLVALYLATPAHYFPAYFILCSSLIVTIRSDLETMLISRYMTLYLIPVAWAFALTGYLPISINASILGALLGYFFLYLVARVFYFVTKKHGIGQGDLELLALIGAFLGPLGCWFSLFLGSLVGSVIGLIYIWRIKGGRHVKIPFGPFLAAGAILYIFFQDSILQSGLITF
jgi:leader peptidase (prepilin peptidase)/N-methyltransferase